MNRMARAFMVVSLGAALAACSSSDSDDVEIQTPLDVGVDDSIIDTESELDLTTITPFVPVIVDPAPEFAEPGSFSCDGCPNGDFTELSFSTPDSSFVSSGQVTGADGNGSYTIIADDGSAIDGVIATDDNGNFSTTLPLFCGIQTIKYIWSNDAGRYVLVNEANRTDCSSADIQITLNWDNLGIDFELHLVEQGGRINDPETDCTWNTCVSVQPDWGVIGDTSDNPVKDVDDTGNFGPENIFLSNPEAGTYSVFVEHWNSGGSPMADGAVVFNVAGETTVTEIVDLPPFSVWYVGTIEWPSGEVVLDNRRLDCAENWSSGCTLDLPAQWPDETTNNQ